MHISELNGKRVALCPRSITCKDENGKTCGIVTGAKRWSELAPRESFEHFKTLKEAGLWGNGMTGNVFLYCGKLYFLHDLRTLEFYEKVFSRTQDENELQRYNQKKQIAEQAAAAGVVVVPCYVMQ